jgi:hypothetical protein
MDPVLVFLIPYLLNLAAGLHSGKLLEKEHQEFKEKLVREAAAGQAVMDRLTLKEQLRLVGTETARRCAADGVSPVQEQMLRLLTDEVFQAEIARWLTAWRPAEKKQAEAGLTSQMVKALQRDGVEERHLENFTARYFDRLEKVVFSDPLLANWRLTLALQAAFERLEESEAIICLEGRETRQEVREQHEVTRQEVKEMAAQQAGLQIQRFSVEQRFQAEHRFRDLALESCDIMDLHNLPEGDRHIAARQQELKLRRLYVPLRVRVEFTVDRLPGEPDLEKIEKQRDEIQSMRVEGRGNRITGSAKKDDKIEEEDKNRVPVGERLAKSGRLVLLGDPGSGKTTLVRWIATAYLLRLKEDPAWQDLPDVATLPGQDWLPIVVRCRDLGDSCKTGSIYDVLGETFRKAQLSDAESAALQAVIIGKLAAGQAILMVDGLDEIGNPGVRARFCQQIERLQAAFPRAPMIVTSRIVGYREMNYRIGRGFEHATVTGFTKKDKDEFARRWCEITELPERAAKAVAELTHAIHSTDRIERLAVNPMLLTTLALVKRKVGKLPERRADLYWEAVLVLLNWRSEVDEPIDHHEAIPQLQYVAFEMCRQGVQRLREEEILGLLERMRVEYPNLRALKKHDPGEFLRLLERRTGILLEVGEVRYKGRQSPVFEFRHLTFQEYWAALALVDGRFPGRDKAKSLAQQIAPLAGETEEYSGKYHMRKEVIVKDNWREVLRLVVACCGDDDVDEVLLAILTPLSGEDAEKTARARAVLAISCLADEPNISDAAARQIIETFARQVKEGDGSWPDARTTVDAAALELVGLEWETLLRAELIREFCRREPLQRWNPGGLCGMMVLAATPEEETEFHPWLLGQVSRLTSGDETIAIEAALALMIMTYLNRRECITGMVNGLMAMLDKNGPSAHAAAWALYWLSEKKKWTPNPNETGKLIAVVSNPSIDIDAVRWAIIILGETKDPQSMEPLIKRLADENENIDVRTAAIEALGNIGDPRAVEPLLKRLEDENAEVRTAALGALAKIGEKETERKLLTRHLDGTSSWLDPKDPVNEKRIKFAARELKLSAEEVRRRYERLGEKYGLRLEWKVIDK